MERSSPHNNHASRLPLRRRLALLAPALLGLGAVPWGSPQVLPDSPGTLLARGAATNGDPWRGLALGDAFLPQTTSPTRQGPCKPGPSGFARGSTATAASTRNCSEENPVQSVVTHPVRPLTPRSKAQLAIRDFEDPFNFITIAGYSGIAIASNAHSAFGPGFAGWGRLTGYSLAEDAQGEFTGTFLLPSLLHQDPRYHRMPEASVGRRLVHAVAHTYVSQHDDGTRMPNYATLINYPLSAEIANLYVPGIQTDAASTARRFGIGLATDPSGTLVAEFLPDIARHIHVHIILVQEIVNKVVSGGTAPNVQ